MTSRATYYRVQPAGLDLDHCSETSADETADGLHVFLEPWEAAALPNGLPEAYGDEVVILSAEADWEDNGDVEGVQVDPSTASVIHRVPWSEFRALWCDSARDRELFAMSVSSRWPVAQ